MKRSPGSPSANANDSGVGHQRRVGISDPELPTHAQMSQDRVAIGEGNHRYLPRRRGAAKVSAGGLQLEVFGPGEVPAYRSRMEYLHPGDLAPSDAVRETAAYHLDLRKLRHRSRRRAEEEREDAGPQATTK